MDKHINDTLLKDVKTKKLKNIKPNGYGNISNPGK